MLKEIKAYLYMQIAGQWTLSCKRFFLDAVHHFDPFEERHEVALHRFRETVLVREYHSYSIHVHRPGKD